MTQINNHISIYRMSKKLISLTIVFLLSFILAVLVLSLDRINKAKVGGGYENGLQIDTYVKK